jgi:hypothetical protein
MPSRKRKPVKRKPVCFAVFDRLTWQIDFTVVPSRFQLMVAGEVMARIDYFRNIMHLKPKRRQAKGTALFFNHQLHKVQDRLMLKEQEYEVGQTVALSF